MQELGKGLDFDPTGRSLGKVSALGYENQFNTIYDKAHQEALQAEYRWLRDKVGEISGIELSLSEVAVGDGDRLGTNISRHYHSISGDDFKNNRPWIDGMPIDKHPSFRIWETRAESQINISESVRKKLGLETKQVEIFKLISAVKAYSPK